MTTSDKDELPLVQTISLCEGCMYFVCRYPVIPSLSTRGREIYWKITPN